MQQPRQGTTKLQLLHIWEANLSRWGHGVDNRSGGELKLPQREEINQKMLEDDTARLSREPATSSTHFHPIAGLLDLLTILHLGRIPRARVSSLHLWGVWNASWSSQPYGGFAEQLIGSRRLKKTPHIIYIISKHHFFCKTQYQPHKPHSIN